MSNFRFIRWQQILYSLCTPIMCECCLLIPPFPPKLLSSSWLSSSEEEERKNRLQTFHWKYTSGISIHVQHNQNVIQYNWKMNKIYEKKEEGFGEYHISSIMTSQGSNNNRSNITYLFVFFPLHAVKNTQSKNNT